MLDERLCLPPYKHTRTHTRTHANTHIKAIGYTLMTLFSKISLCVIRKQQENLSGSVAFFQEGEYFILCSYQLIVILMAIFTPP